MAMSPSLGEKLEETVLASSTLLSCDQAFQGDIVLAFRELSKRFVETWGLFLALVRGGRGVFGPRLALR